MGDYSEDFKKSFAKSIVKTPKHEAFKNKQNGFYFAYGDKTLHYGKSSYEGSLELNKKGLKFYKSYWKKYFMGEED